MQAELLETAAGLDAPPAATAVPVQTTPSTLALFSTLTRTVCKLRADGGGRSPKSFETNHLSVSIFHGVTTQDDKADNNEDVLLII